MARELDGIYRIEDRGKKAFKRGYKSKGGKNEEFPRRVTNVEFCG